MGHTRLSPSGAHRWVQIIGDPDGPDWHFEPLCPGSVRLEANYPDTDNEYSLRGTAAHWVGERCFKEEKTPGYWRGQGIEVELVDGSMTWVVFEEEDSAAVWTYVDYVHRRMEQIPGVHAEFESELNPGAWLDRDDCKGTGDCSLYSNTELEFVDYKHGVNPTDARIQLFLYGVGGCARMDWSQLNHDLPIKLTVVQPRAQHPDGPIRSWELTARDIFARIEELKAAAAATDDPNAPLVPGESQCRWCKARGDCPALTQEAMSVFTPQQSSGNDWDQIETNLGRPADQLSMTEVVNILDKKPMIQAWLKAVTETATKWALDGKEVPGYKVCPGKSNRQWSLSDEEVIKKLSTLKNRDTEKSLGQKSVTNTKPLSPAQAEKKIQPLISERTWRNVQKLIIKPEGAPTLVPVTDPREPLKGPEQVFEKQEEIPAWLQ